MLNDKLKSARQYMENSLEHYIKPGTKKTLRFIKKNPKKVTMIICTVFFIFCGFIALWISTFQMPDLQSFDTRIVSQSTKIYDRTGKILLYDVHANKKEL